MKSGLEGRNNKKPFKFTTANLMAGLNEVRPRRPEQSNDWFTVIVGGVGLNEVRPRRPEQYSARHEHLGVGGTVSMKSGLEGRNNTAFGVAVRESAAMSQ